MLAGTRRIRGPSAVAAGIVALLLVGAALLFAGVLDSEPLAGGEGHTRSSTAVADRAEARPAIPARRSSQRLYWGAWIGDQLTGTEPPWDMSAVRRFEDIVGKRVSIVHFAAPFADCSSGSCTPFTFPAAEMTKIRRHGAVPFLSWSSASLPFSANQPAYQLRDLIRGRHDGFIRSYARAVKRWGHPFFLRFDWEMNGDWFPWGIRANGNRASQFVPAWRHVHRIFDSVGAKNATWVWCPYSDQGGRYNLRALYPGNAFVDWTCVDGYNWGPGSPANPAPWTSFRKLFRSTYLKITRKVARRKPMVIGEIATSDFGGSKAAWIRDALARLAAGYPKIRGIVWFDKDDRGAGWPIETPHRVRKAFSRGIARRAYAPNLFPKIARSPIRPPTSR